MESKYKLRKKKSMLSFYITLSIFFIAGVILFTYVTLSYMKINNIEKLKTEDINLIFNFIPMIKFEFETLIDTFKQQIHLWAVYLIFGFAVFIMATSNNKDDFHGVEKGSASWSDKYTLKKYSDKTGIPLGNKLYATVNNPKGKYFPTHNLNEIDIGGSGAGKSFRKIKPDIMNLYGSYVVTDPSGELYRDCYKFLIENGYKVRVLNLFNVGCGNSYNPFEYIKSEEDILNIADLFMKNSAGDGDKEDFWAASAKDLLLVIMMYLFKEPTEIKSFGRLIRLLNSIQYNKNKQIDELCELSRCMARHATNFPNDAGSVNWESVKATPQDTMGGIIKTLATRLGIWAMEDVDILTAKDEMDFDNVGVEKTAIFLIIPPARNPYKVISAMFYMQLFERLMYVATNVHQGRLPLLVSCELDEFANIGQIPSFSEILAVVRKFNIRICIVLQGLSQLKALYEKTYEAIIGNCSIFNFLGTNDLESKKYLVEKLGKTTIRTGSKSWNRGSQGGGSDTESLDGRDLLTLDEVPRALKGKGKDRKYGGNAIVFIDEEKPFFINKFDTKKHPAFPKMGSTFKTGLPNNTYIMEQYAELGKERKANYKEELDLFNQVLKEKAEKELETLAKVNEEKENLEQEKLAKDFGDDFDEIENQKNNKEDIKNIPLDLDDAKEITEDFFEESIEDVEAF